MVESQLEGGKLVHSEFISLGNTHCFDVNLLSSTSSHSLSLTFPFIHTFLSHIFVVAG
jgi:hypothetical protein